MRGGPDRVVLKEGHTFSLLCLPFAGGSARSYVRLANHTDGWNVTAVQPPAGFAQTRPGLDELARCYLEMLAGDLRGPGILFGHSLGAAVAHRMVQLRSSDWPEDLQVVLSAPPVPGRDTGELLGLDDGGLLAAATRTGMLPDLGTSDDFAIRFLLPGLREDLAVLGSRGWRPAPAAAPVHLLGGTDDGCCPPAALAAVADALRPRSVRLLDGGHMYVLDRPAETAAALTEISTELAAGSAAARAG
ncbi:alpha/beta fold hydrolase [Streptomyces sp. NPDC089919]|uniref:thioesterase II family protein n=1 Tax=Streptomyces sp. NPDC089919 TaxID=3155188 RepID=UPI00342D71C2